MGTGSRHPVQRQAAPAGRAERGPPARAVGSLVALFAAFLVFGRLVRRTYLNELLLACSLAVLALSNLIFVTVPTVVGWAPDDLTVWAAVLARSLGALLFACAAFATRRELRRAGPVLALAAVATITALGLATLFAHTLLAWLCYANWGRPRRRVTIPRDRAAIPRAGSWSR